MSTPYSLANWTWSDGYSATAIRLRQAHTAMISRLGVGANTAGRSGVITGYGDALKVTPSAGLTLAVDSGDVVVQSSATVAGCYIGVVPAGATVTLTAADPTYPRYDRIVALVTDIGTSGSTMEIIPVDGTPAASPVIPAEPANATTLATVYVGAGVVSISAGNITDGRQFTAAAGGIVPVTSSTTFPATGTVGYQYFHDMANSNLWARIGSTNYPYRNAFKCTSTTRPTDKLDGTVIYETDTGRLNLWNGTAWMWPAPRGVVSGFHTTDVTPDITDGVERLTNLVTPTYNMEANRLYRLKLDVEIAPTAIGDSTWFFRFRETNLAGTVLKSILVPTRDFSTGYAQTFTMSHYLKPTVDAAKIYAVTHVRLSGTNSLGCNTGAVVLEDLGPDNVSGI